MEKGTFLQVLEWNVLGLKLPHCDPFLMGVFCSRFLRMERGISAKSAARHFANTLIFKDIGWLTPRKNRTRVSIAAKASHKWGANIDTRETRVHSDLKNIMRGTWHKCETCTMTFRQHSDLQKHWVTHTHEKPHKCQFCGKGFTQLGSKYRHERIACSLRPDAAL